MVDLNPIDEHLGELPTILYKYRTFDRCGYGVAMGLDGVAYFASASELNDPFDTRFHPSSVFTRLKEDALRDYLARKARQHEPRATEARIAELVSLGVKNRQRILAGDQSSFEVVMEIQAKRRGILSLTTKPNHPAMWAYYSDNHKGLCIGLRTKAIGLHQRSLLERSELMMLSKVEYQERMPAVSVDTGPDGMTEEELEELDRTFYTKSRHWEHEEEYRVLYDGYTSKPYVFGDSAVEEVILGLNVSAEDSTSFIAKLDQAGSQTVVKQARRSLSEFKLEFDVVRSG